jgi:hypothetical protein
MSSLNLYRRSQRSLSNILTSSISSTFCLNQKFIPVNLTNLNLIRNYSQCNINTIKNNKFDVEINVDINIQDINVRDIKAAIKSLKDNNDLNIKQIKKEDLKDSINQIRDIHSNINLHDSKNDEEFILNNHEKCILLWENMDKNQHSLITVDIIEMMLVSSSYHNRWQLVIDIVEFGQSLGILNDMSTNIGLLYLEILGALDLTEWGDKNALNKAISVLDKLIILGNVNSKIFEETLMICSNHGKWRSMIEILEKMQKLSFSLNTKVLYPTIISCSKIGNDASISAAFNIFKYLVRKDIPRNKELYHFLFLSLSKNAMVHSDKISFIWDRLILDNIKPTSIMYSTYIRALCIDGEIESAKAVLHDAIEKSNKKIPKYAYLSLYSGLISHDLKDEAESLIIDMNKLGMSISSKDVSFHVQSLIKSGLLTESVRYLDSCVQDSASYQFIDQTTYNSLFNDLLELDLFEDAIQLYDIAKRHVSSLPSSITGIINTSSLFPRLIESLELAGLWAKALDLIDREEFISDSMFLSLINSLFICNKGDVAFDRHEKRLIEFGFNEDIAMSLIRNLSKCDRWDDVILCLEQISQLSNSPTSLAPSSSLTPPVDTISSNLNTALSSLFTTAIKISLTTPNGHGQAARLLHYQQQTFGIKPSWICTKYAISAMFQECSWNSLIDQFSSRYSYPDYTLGDESTYNRALISCNALGRWQDSLELLACLLEEVEKPKSYIFEAVILQLVEHNQGEFLIQVLKLMKDRNIMSQQRMLSECLKKSSSNNKIRNILLREAIKVGLSQSQHELDKKSNR